jgi:putative endonuclease
LQQRINIHNQALYGSKCFTASAKDWRLIIFIQTENYTHAIRLERKIKAMKSSKYIENLLKYPELIEKIILETKST